MSIMRAQRGFTVMGLLVTLMLVSTITMVGLKLLPHYMDFYSIQKLITAPIAERAYGVRNERDFYDYVERGMTVNNVRNIGIQDVMSVKMQQGMLEVHVVYERREKLFYNIDLVITFDRSYLVAAQ